MDIVKTADGNKVTVVLSGSLDTVASAGLETEIDHFLGDCAALVFDFSAVDSISSRGLRVLLGLQEKMKRRGCMCIKHVSRELMHRFLVTGFLDILKIEPAVPQISTQGCRLIGAGVTGECYQVDDDTLLKLFFEHVADDLAQKEKGFARAAFAAGIPTVISYDVVACGRRQGILFEKLNGKTLSQIIIDDPDNLENHVRLFADLSKHVHITPGDPLVFPKTKDICIEAVGTVDFLNKRQRQAIIARVEEIPDAVTCIHGDLHTSNIMMQGSEACLIDMADFSIGYHMFDVAQVYNIFYSSLVTGISEKAVGMMTTALAFRIWTLFEEHYFGARTEKQRLQVRAEASFFGCLRMFMFYDAFGKEPHMRQWLLERFVPLFD